MAELNYIVTHDGDVLAKGLTAVAAVLFCARYDGWGADFARSADGVMALRQSSGHIGNNDWIATGEEPALFSVVSIEADDEEAIEECADRLVLKIDQLHSLMACENMFSYIKHKVQAAIDEYEGDTGPGMWSVQDGESSEDHIMISYTLDVVESENPAPHPELYKDSSAILTKWGGNAIVEAAGVVIYSAEADSFTDKYGDLVYSECFLVGVDSDN